MHSLAYTMSHTNAYCTYYRRQIGGEIPIFRGGQHGAGLGDILRGVLRFLAPIALRGISTFAGNMVQARDKGAGWADAAKSSVGPTLGSMRDAFANRPQTGGSALFSGVHGIPFASTAYKSVKRKAKTGKAHKTGKKPRIDTNY